MIQGHRRPYVDPRGLVLGKSSSHVLVCPGRNLLHTGLHRLTQLYRLLWIPSPDGSNSDRVSSSRSVLHQGYVLFP